mgnify:CR=1 FL=1
MTKSVQEPKFVPQAKIQLLTPKCPQFDKKREKLKDFYKGFIPPILLMAGILFTIVIQPDFSTAAVIGLIGFSMLFIGGAKLSHIITTGVVSIVIMIPVMLMRSYRMKRVIYWLGSIFGVNGGNEHEVMGYQAQHS